VPRPKCGKSSTVPPTPMHSSVRQQNRRTSSRVVPNAQDVTQATPTRVSAHQRQKRLTTNHSSLPSVVEETTVTQTSSETIAAENAHVGDEDDKELDNHNDNDDDKDKLDNNDDDKDDANAELNNNDDDDDKDNADTNLDDNNNNDNNKNDNNNDDNDANAINHNFVEDSFFSSDAFMDAVEEISGEVCSSLNLSAMRRVSHLEAELDDCDPPPEKPDFSEMTEEDAFDAIKHWKKQRKVWTDHCARKRRHNMACLFPAGMSLNGRGGVKCVFIELYVLNLL
jgi:hypothetical protein